MGGTSKGVYLIAWTDHGGYNNDIAGTIVAPRDTVVKYNFAIGLDPA